MEQARHIAGMAAKLDQREVPVKDGRRYTVRAQQPFIEGLIPSTDTISGSDTC